MLKEKRKLSTCTLKTFPGKGRNMLPVCQVVGKVIFRCNLRLSWFFLDGTYISNCIKSNFDQHAKMSLNLALDGWL